MKMPTNYGEPYRSNFQKLFPALAKKYKIPLVPFLLEGVGGNPKLNIADGIHPNPEGHKFMAQTVQKVLETLL
jgi:acyl-CoA thioesterase-1